jgi:hypothetical protein
MTVGGTAWDDFGNYNFAYLGRHLGYGRKFLHEGTVWPNARSFLDAPSACGKGLRPTDLDLCGRGAIERCHALMAQLRKSSRTPRHLPSQTLSRWRFGLSSGLPRRASHVASGTESPPSPPFTKSHLPPRNFCEFDRERESLCHRASLRSDSAGDGAKYDPAAATCTTVRAHRRTSSVALQRSRR